MPTIGSRELKAHLGAVLRDVRERQEAYAVTQRGRVIAHLVPESTARDQSADFDVLWSEMDRLAMEIGREWPKDTSAAEAVSADRRES